ncbi:hypothetical protein M422DRAFT_34927 [Sphaerobolus stellatus SS14]|uniref:Uncharacterized protein n=1 Tax=Sphaerobolus stellatus (strain SS14) TaxID=990650 RepID=A0A0C9TWN9_SPHS4|nr:hypothetical protein M422DRAFT_34927 [Sphaerobolus stellatus SS14]
MSLSLTRFITAFDFFGLFSIFTSFLGRTGYTREDFIQLLVLQNFLILIAILGWSLVRLFRQASLRPEEGLIQPLRHPETDPIMILVTKVVTTETHEDSSILPLNSNSRSAGARAQESHC